MNSQKPEDPETIDLLAESGRIIVDSLTEFAIALLDSEGRVVTWSSGAERVTGFRSDEAVGHHLSKFHVEIDRATASLRQIRESGETALPLEWEGWCLRRDGSRFPALTKLSGIKDTLGAHAGFVSVTRDLSERRHAQDVIRDADRRFRLFVDSVTDYAIYMLDPSGIIINWNAGAERLKGYRPDEVIGRHFSCFYTREDRAAGLPMKALAEAAREGRFESEGERVRKDGSRFWADVVVDTIRDSDGKLLGFAKITRDVTEKRQAQEALRESEREFRLLVGGVTDYALFMIDPNGIVTNWNVGAEKIKGYKANEIVGQHFSRFYTEADRNAGLPLRALYEATEHGRYEAEGWRVRKDGTLFWASVVIDSIRDDAGKLIGFAKITRDITERRNTQETLRQTQEELAQTRKMEALGQLTGGIAHDFNNLLMVVSGQSALLKRRLSAPKDLRALESIEHAVTHGTRLTRQLLSFGQKQPLNPSVIELYDRIETLREMLKSASRGDIHLEIMVGEDIWPVCIDVSDMELALVNLAVNARDAMESGGIMTLSARNVTLGANNDVGVEGDFVAIAVSDTGMGIPPDVLPKIFEPFFTTKESGKGTGLGLTQVYAFARQSGGKVQVNSARGQGTTFTIYVPRSLLRPAEQPEEPVEPMPDTASGTILVVEDNPQVRQVSATLLEQMGYKVHFVGDAAEALEEIVRHPSFDLVFSDIVMPGSMDGIALARAIRARYPKIPVLLTSGYAKAAASAEGEFPILRKPFEVRTLASAVKGAIALQKSA